jgi:uncharacterized protein
MVRTTKETEVSMTAKTMRRKDREITEHEALRLLASCEYGVLSTAGKDGQPYGIPLSYVCRDRCIYFHCALTGHKLDNMADNPRVSFCVVGNTKVLPDQFATEYESAVAFGVVSEVVGAEWESALGWLLEKYSPAHLKEGREYIGQKGGFTKVMKVVIDQVSGKARRPI